MLVSFFSATFPFTSVINDFNRKPKKGDRNQVLAKAHTFEKKDGQKKKKNCTIFYFVIRLNGMFEHLVRHHIEEKNNRSGAESLEHRYIHR